MEAVLFTVQPATGPDRAYATPLDGTTAASRYGGVMRIIIFIMIMINKDNSDNNY